MNKTQLKALSTQIHGLAVKGATGKKTTQDRAMEKISTLINQAIEAEVKQAYADMAAHVRGLAEKLEPSPKRKAAGKKKVTRRKPVAARRKSESRRGRAKPTEKVAEQAEQPETTTP